MNLIAKCFFYFERLHHTVEKCVVVVFSMETTFKQFWMCLRFLFNFFCYHWKLSLKFQVFFQFKLLNCIKCRVLYFSFCEYKKIILMKKKNPSSRIRTSDLRMAILVWRDHWIWSLQWMVRFNDPPLTIYSPPLYQLSYRRNSY